MKVDIATEQHLPALGRTTQLARLDDYGVAEFEKWQKELAKFVYGRIARSLPPDEYSAFQQNQAKVWHSINARVLAEMSENPVFWLFSKDMTPTQFEHFCAEQLRQARWGPRVATRNGDQGVDVIAEKNDVGVVVQCKLCSGAFGNDASSKSIYDLCQLDSGKGLHWICHMLSSKYRKGLRVLGYPDEIGSAAT